MYWLHTLSPTHVGTGRGVGYIDLPLHRDKVTGWPLIPGSAFKGVWADHFDATENNRQANLKLKLAFGVSDRVTNDSNAGALIPTDARLICLPIRSFHGTFAWCTSALVLSLLHRDLTYAGVPHLPALPADIPETEVHRHTTTKVEEGGRIFLEDLDFAGKQSQPATDWAARIAGWVFPDAAESSWRTCLMERFAIVPNFVFDFLSQTGTEVCARVRIDDDLKTVREGQLWNEESLPAESILAGIISCDRLYAAQSNGISEAGLLQEFATSPLTLQIGGKASVGRGRVRCIFASVNGGH